MSTTVEEYVAKIGRITSEYKQLSRKEVEFDDDGDVSIETIKERKINIYKYIKRKAIKCEDIRIAIAVIEYTPKMFKYLPPKFKHDKKFFLDAMPIIESARILKFADEVIQEDLDCCIEALRIDYTVYPYVSEKIKNNPKVIDVYEWGREMSQIPQNIPDFDLSKYGPDEDDKYFMPPEQKNLEVTNNEVFEEDIIEDKIPNIVPPPKPKEKKSDNFDEDATLDWGTDNISYDEDDDEDGEGNNGVKQKEASDDDPELPPKKDIKKKGFFSKLFG